MKKEQEILGILSKRLGKLVKALQLSYERLYELRLRVHEPFIVIYGGLEYFVGRNGRLTKQAGDAYYIEEQDLRDTVELVSNYSLYAYEEEIRQGYITVQGGHRVGLAGTVVVENGKIKSVKHISFINIRVSHQILGCAKDIMSYVREGGQVCHTLLISPPRGGKTTLLRDIIRHISDGDAEHEGMTVGVVDERSELAACYLGMPQNDLGIRTDILDCCPKAEGMLMLIRSMAPQVIAVDEIGNADDIEAIAYVINCGCKILATVHGSSIDDIKNKPVLRRLVEERIFERYVVLTGGRRAGQVEQVFDAMGNPLFDDKLSRRSLAGVS